MNKMTDIQAARALRNILDSYTHEVLSRGFTKSIEEDTAALRIAIKDVEKQIPVLVNRDPKNKYHYPVCKNWLSLNQSYCDMCGQAIDWSEAENENL